MECCAEKKTICTIFFNYKMQKICRLAGKGRPKAGKAVKRVWVITENTDILRLIVFLR